ncbi:MAG: folate-binding protein YgfZ [Methylococcales bacterium]|jgi:tRNA-modifying protein YgfZ|nr:folate-binding protein YgfZ [Methylococcales bacterium]MBT7408340.1 folate-binding protein YgfZ [Methylococcales bacterium]
MNPEWNDFLQGYKIEHNHEFGNNTLCDLTDFDLITCDGNDADTFLQGQLTNDIKEVTENQAQLSAYCSQKGRMYAVFLILKASNTLQLFCPADISDGIIKRLKMYIMRSKVSLFKNEDLIQFGLYGDNATAQLQKFNSTLPSENYQSVSDNGLTIVKLPGNGNGSRYQLIADLNTAKSVWKKLASECHISTSDAWRLQQIHAGIPTIFSPTSEAFIPQMANLHQMNAVNFKKGCYVGQEIVARTQYLGKTKRHMITASCPGNTLSIKPGDLLYNSANNEQKAGKIVDAKTDGENIFLLAVTEIKYSEFFIEVDHDFIKLVLLNIPAESTE